MLPGQSDSNGLPVEKYEPEVWRFFCGMRSTVDGGDAGRMQVMSKIIILAYKRIKNDRIRKDAQW